MARYFQVQVKNIRDFCGLGKSSTWPNEKRVQEMVANFMML